MTAQPIPITPPGASSDDWAHLTLLLGLTADLLPVVSNPNAEVSPDSKIRDVGKVPSIYNGHHKVAGFPSWTAHEATEGEVARWSRQRDYGICIQTRYVRALDVDIGDAGAAQAVRQFVLSRVGGLPERRRSNTGKHLLAFALPGDYTKRILKTAHGNIEFLATGQQFIACGTHPSGVRYEWAGGLPDEFPVLTSEQFESLWAAMATEFGVEPPTESKASSKAATLTEAQHADPIAKHLLDGGWVRSSERDGRLHIRCPWEAEHTTDSGDSATSYFPAHTGGYEQGNFKCLHAHCAHRTAADLQVEIGMGLDDFDVIVDAPAATGEPLRFQVVPAHEFAQGQPPEWIVKGVLPRATLGVLFGDSGSGKTFLALDLLGAVVRGIDWRDRRTAQGRGVYIVAEGAGGFRNRLKAYAHQQALDLAALNIGVIGDAPNFMEKADIKALLAAVKAFGKVDVIVVDTFAQVMPGANENAGEDVGKALAHCRALHKHTGALVLLVHHSGKDATRGARGWSGLRAAADVEIEIVRAEADRVATVTKMKDGEDGAEFGFRLGTVVIGQDEEGEEITSCVVEHAAVMPKAQRKPALKGDNEKLVWRVANEMLDLSDTDIHPNHVIEAAIGQMVCDGKRDRRRESAMRALNGLISGRYLALENGLVQLG